MENKWPVRKLGDICEVLNGFAFKSDKYVDEGVRIIRITNVQHGYIEDNDPKFYPIDECERLNQYMLKEQDLLMSLTGNVGRVGLMDNKFLPAALNQRVACLRVKNENVELKYLFHHLNSELFETRCIQSAKGIAQKNMSTEWLKEYPIPIPPLPEQSRIVEELDQLSNIIEKKRQQLSELDNLAQSIFYDMFGDPVTNEKGWEVKKLGEVCVDIIRGPFGSALKKDYFVPKGGDTYKVYEQKHAIQKDVSLGAYYISSDRYKSMMRFTVYENDIIMSCSGTIGEMFIIPNNAEVGIINQALLLFRMSTCINQTFFLNVMNAVKSSMETKGAGIKNIGSVKYIKQIDISFPPLNLQQLFAQKIEAIEKEKELIKQSIKETEELFNSRMDYYFG